MELKCVVVTVLIILIPQCSCVPGDALMYMPPLEVRAMDIDNSQFKFPFPNTRFQPMIQNVPVVQQSPILHKSVVQPVPTATPPPKQHDHHNFTVNEFMSALNDLADHEEDSHEETRAAGKEYESPSQPYPPYHQPYGYSRPNGYPSRPPSYGPYPQQQYHEPAAAYVPPTTVHHVSAKKPELITSLLKPVTTKVASKVSGLVGLVLALLTGSAPGGLELKGLADILINGIVKPLLIAKGGIKSLISKLAIPVISLLLINVEFLITIWWLWEECPQPVAAAAASVYSYPKPSYSSNSY